MAWHVYDFGFVRLDICMNVGLYDLGFVWLGGCVACSLYDLGCVCFL